LKFKRAHRIVSRKINKFITRKTLESGAELVATANEFVADIQSCIPRIGFENLYNSDQSGFQLEMHSGRTLAVEGEKKVQCMIQSVSAHNNAQLHNKTTYISYWTITVTTFSCFKRTKW